jgi:hypothetical protein
MRPYFDRGFVLLLLEGEQAIAGSVCYVEGDTLFFHRGGVLDGNEDYVRKDAQAALYYLKVRYAKEHGLSRLDLGHSRAFFGDGVYRHKREWGGAVTVDDDLESWLHVFAFGDPENIRAIAGPNPLIVQTEDGLQGCCAPPDDVSPDDLRRYYAAGGIHGMLVYTPHTITPTVVAFPSLADAAE